ncbi:MAG: HAMP domain-containing histidine kinase [Actinobacteria bacterium]|nr:HAMP domain-containing histidine kinase [Actinomycetota bacterium]
MRRRILLATLAVIAAALLAFAVPLGVAVRSLLTDRALDSVSSEVEAIALYVEREARTCGEVELFLGALARSELDLSLHGTDGRVLATEPGHRPALDAAVAIAARGGSGRAVGDATLAAAVPLESRVCGPAMILRGERPTTELAGSVRGAWVAIAAVGAGVLALAAVAMWWQGRRLVAPLEDLAGSARRLGDGDFTSRAPRSGLEEPDAIADALDLTAERLGRALQRGSAFAADASHQLRTPLTALRLHLESLEGADPDALAAALAEADRLEATVDELVALTGLDAPEREVDLGALVTGRVDAWRELAAADGRRVELDVAPTPPLRVRPAAVGQALQVLLDNALAHGAGTVTVQVRATGGDRGEGPGVRICVLDEGSGAGPAAAPARAGADRGGGPLPVRGGRGLVLARSLIEAEGGRLTIGPAAPHRTDHPGTRACLVLRG